MGTLDSKLPINISKIMEQQIHHYPNGASILCYYIYSKQLPIRYIAMWIKLSFIVTLLER